MQPDTTSDVLLVLRAPSNVTGINFTLNYNPSIISVENFSLTLPGMAFAVIDNTNGTAKFAVVFNTSISGTSAILKLKLRAISTGLTVVYANNVEVSIENFTPVSAVATNGTITVGSQKGDLNGDGRITIDDVTQLAWMLFGKAPQDRNGDLNGNGVIDIGDLTKLVYYLLGKIDKI